MNIIIVGGGKLGSALVDFLIKEGHDIALIDTNYNTVESLVGKYDILGICGNGANVETLRDAGIGKAQILIAATPSDEVNILCCLEGKKLGAHHTIARVRAPEYSKQLVFMRKELGISMVVNPELETAAEIFRMIRSSRTLKIDSFAKGRADIVEIKIADDSPFAGLQLLDINNKFKFKVLVCAVQRNNEIFIPDGRFRIEAGDKISVTASPSELDSMFKLLGYTKQRVRSVLIVGGGTIAIYLAQQLIENNIRVKILEMSEKRCEELSEKLPKATIINGNGSDESLLSEEGVEKYDACVALTGIDEENIVISLYAKAKKIPTIISKVNNSSLLRMINSLTLENTISPKQITSNHIARYVRSKQNDHGASVQTLYKLVENQVEAVEFIVSDNEKCIGIPLRNLKLKSGILIACIVRGGKTLIPGGDDTIEINDNVIVVSNGLYLRTLSEILA
ncbi:MAG: Trk system potassium transporter TrkA [Clostridia bacterium]|nr:Trk system potassium transporter TrkA [Clostridia bacterium]